MQFAGHARQQIRADGRQNAQPDPPGERLLSAERHRAKLLDLGQDAAGLADNVLAGRGWRGAVAAALEDRDAKIKLCLGNLGREARLADMELSGRFMEAPAIGHGDDVLKLSEGRAHDRLKLLNIRYLSIGAIGKSIQIGVTNQGEKHRDPNPYHSQAAQAFPEDAAKLTHNPASSRTGAARSYAQLRSGPAACLARSWAALNPDSDRARRAPGSHLSHPRQAPGHFP